MSKDASLLSQVSELVSRFAPNQPSPASVTPDLELVRDLGFDSVRLVELFLTIDEVFKVSLPIESILGGKSLSVRELAAYLPRATTPPR